MVETIYLAEDIKEWLSLSAGGNDAYVLDETQAIDEYPELNIEYVDAIRHNPEFVWRNEWTLHNNIPLFGKTEPCSLDT